MKYLKINKLIVVMTIALVFGSCGDLEELNVDPNNPIAVPASNLVSQAQWELYDLQHSRLLNGEWGLLMVQQWAQNEYAEESRYLVDANSFDGAWSTIYADVLKELSVAKTQIIENTGIPSDVKANQLAIIDISQVEAYNIATDLWGDIPYSQSIDSENPNPCYDSQQSIYGDLLSRLDASLSSITEGASSFEGGDLIFDGNMSKWKKLGASLMLRLAMRISDVDASTAGEYVTKSVNYGVMESNDDNALFVFGGDPSLSNPLWRDVNLGNRDDFAVSDVLVNTLSSMGDPRLDIYAGVTPAGIINGMPYGLPDAEAFALKSTTSRPSETVRSEDAPHVIMDYSEVSFLMAEAIERGFTSGDAAQWYANGVTSSMNYWGITDGIDDYLAANPYDAANWKESIAMQKWIGFYMNGLQGWAEWRRLDYPNLELPAAAANDVIPVRLPYPISEDTRNGNCLSEVTSDIDDLSGKLWWDVN